MDYVLSAQIGKELLERLQVPSKETGARLESAQTTTWEERGFCPHLPKTVLSSIR